MWYRIIKTAPITSLPVLRLQNIVCQMFDHRQWNPSMADHSMCVFWLGFFNLFKARLGLPRVSANADERRTEISARGLSFQGQQLIMIIPFSGTGFVKRNLGSANHCI